MRQFSRGQWTCGLYRKRERHNCQSGQADFEFAWLVCDRSGRKNCFSARNATLDGQEDIYVRPPLLLSRWGFTEKGTLWRLKKALCGLRSAPRLWGLTRDAVLTALVMCHEGKDYILKQSCADLALWIVVCLRVETSLLLRDDQGHAIGSVVGYVLTHVDDMLAAGDIPVLHLFTIALKKVGNHSEQHYRTWERR